MTSQFASLILASVVALGLVACGGDKPAEQPKPAQTETKPAPAPAPEPAKEPTPEPAKAEAPAPSEATAPATPSEPLAADAGQKRYEATCKMCHEQGLLDAPKLGDKTAWQARIAKGKDTLYKNSTKGFNKMPAQAVGDVSEAEVKAAVDYMVEKSS